MSALRVLRRPARVAAFLGVTSVMLPAYLARRAVAGTRSRDETRDRWVHAWSVSLLRVFSIRVEIAGEPADKVGAGRLVVANHRSAIDVAVLLSIFGGHMVSRADLSTWPLLGAAARSVGTVFVDRSSTVSGAGAIREMRHLLADGQTVILFPEGTTFEGDTVRPFQAGAFVAALRTNASILPVGLAYPEGSGAAFVDETFTRHLSRMAAADPTRVLVRIGRPIPVLGAARATDLASRARSHVQDLVLEARRSAQPPPTR